MKVVSLPLCHIVLICEMEIECSYTFYEAIQKSVFKKQKWQFTEKDFENFQKDNQNELDIN